MSKYRIAIIAGETKLDAIMHAADLFENFKRLILEPVIHDVTLTPSNTIDQVLARVVTQFAESDKYFLVAVLALGTPRRWIDPEVKVVSTGTQWATLPDFILNLEARYAPAVGFSLN